MMSSISSGLHVDMQAEQPNKFKRICKKCKTEFEDDNGYPVCNYCLELLDDWE